LTQKTRRGFFGLMARPLRIEYPGAFIEAVFTGSSGSYRPTHNIAIRATTTKNNRRVVDEKAQTGVFSPSGEWRFIALARGPFCEPLRVDVLVDGEVEKTAVLNFQCGE
jgi:hypothetical protein